MWIDILDWPVEEARIWSMHWEALGRWAVGAVWRGSMGRIDGAACPWTHAVSKQRSIGPVLSVEVVRRTDVYQGNCWWISPKISLMFFLSSEGNTWTPGILLDVLWHSTITHSLSMNVLLHRTLFHRKTLMTFPVYSSLIIFCFVIRWEFRFMDHQCATQKASTDIAEIATVHEPRSRFYLVS